MTTQINTDPHLMPALFVGHDNPLNAIDLSIDPRRRIVMKTVAYLLLAGLFILQLPVSVAAQQTGSMRCRNGIVSIGDTIPDVVKKCGLPAFQDRREQTRPGGRRHDRSVEIITVDDWIYNFGPQEFMYQVTFNNGRVAIIESLAHGF